jgi:predicted PurR-regulated permease PerM
VAWLEKRIKRRTAATLLIFLVLTLAASLLAVTLTPPVVSQTNQLIRHVPDYSRQLSAPGTFSGDFMRQYDLFRHLKDSQSELIGRLTNASGTFVGFIVGVLSSIVALISIFGLTFFMLMEGPGWLKAFWKIVPAHKRSHGQRLAADMYNAMSGYVAGKVLAAVLAGATAAITMFALGVPYAIALALLVALLSIIPVFGATIAAVIVCLVALVATSPQSALFLAIFFFIYQQVENNILTPVIFKRTVDVSPLLVFISVLVGTAAAGILGALIAIPITASVQILVKDFYARRELAMESKGSDK